MDAVAPLSVELGNARRVDSPSDSSGAVHAAHFQWSETLAADAIGRVDDLMSRLIADVGTICHEQLPPRRGYRWRSEEDRGIVAGRRFVVERRGFRGTVSVLWFARSPSYRTSREGEIAVRLGGRVRLLPQSVGLPRVELDPHLPIRLVGLLVAMGLGTAGMQGLLSVHAHPTLLFLLDAVGNAGCLLLLAAAVTMAAASLYRLSIRIRPRHLAHPSAERYAQELLAWGELERAVGARLTEASTGPKPRPEAEASPTAET